MRDSRGAPEFVFNPRLGETYQEALDLKGNPSIDMDWYETKFKSTNEPYRYTVAHWCATEARFRNHLKKIKKDDAAKLIPLENMLVRITQQDVVYRRYLVPEHRSYVPDFGVYIKVQGANGDVEYRSLSRQLVLFCVERRKAWRMLQSKAGIENREYKAQRSILADVDAGKISKEELFARAEELLKERLQSRSRRTSRPSRGQRVRPVAQAAAPPQRRPGVRIGVDCRSVTTERTTRRMKRSASAVWKGGLKDGKGTVSTESGVLSSVPYNFSNAVRERERHQPRGADRRRARRLFLDGAVAVPRQRRHDGGEHRHHGDRHPREQVDGGFAVTSSHLETTVKIPNADRPRFKKAAEAAKSGCPISKLLNAKITLDARLV